MPEHWKNALGRSFETTDQAPDFCIVNFDNEPARNLFQSERFSWSVSVDPVVIGVSLNHQLIALTEGADVALAGTELYATE
ncbi:MAG: hypothetical protein AAF386_11020 [Pseudomonadota bacterium]